MTKTFALLSIALLSGLSMAAPTHAATRTTEMSASWFADRCENVGGLVIAEENTTLCQTAEIEIECEFLSVRLAECNWAGVDNRTAVTRIIGMANADALVSTTGGVAVTGNGGKGGGYKGPKDLQQAKF
jgi:hypothetical protein